MTKDNPYILCPDCKKFDKEAFENGPVRLDTLTICDHELPPSDRIWLTKEEAKEFWPDNSEPPE